MEEKSLYERVGGQEFFDLLVERFYEGVEADQLLRPMYPDELEESKRWLSLFLAQYWGGPPTYMDERGHPRLRMRHAPYVINKRARDAWLSHMRAAVEQATMSEEDREELWSYLDVAAHQLRNR